MDLSTPSLSYYVSLLYKNVVGEEVFDTRVLTGSRILSHFYSNCAKNVSGGFTVMGINTADSRLKVFAKMPTPYTGSDVHQYILTVNTQNGKIQLNGEDINKDAALTPLIKMKRATKAISFVLPPLSVGFWVFPSANLRECIKFEDDHHENWNVKLSTRSSKSLPKTSKELLLQELIMDTIHGGEESGSNTSQSSARSKRHTIIKKDSSGVYRKRRDVSESIPMHDELHRDTHDGTPVNDELAEENGDSNAYKRSRRFIINSNRPRRSGNLIDVIYKEVDDAKRKNIFAPYNLKSVNLFSKSTRSKRQIPPALEKLFQKFELKKPRKLNRPFSNHHQKSSAAAIPPIATIHDIYSPTVAETSVFKSSENKNLPQGDVYFEIGDDTPHGSPDYVAVDDKGMPPPQRPMQRPIQRVQEPIRDVVDDPSYMNMPNEYFEHMPNDHPRRPAQGQSSNTIPRFGELWEADVYQKPNSPQHDSNQQPEQPKAPQREMEFVVQGLQPTWLKNQENLMQARNNLQQYYVNTHGQPIQISLPGSGHGMSEYDNDDGFFHSRRRRRRSVDPKMNDEIEEKLRRLDDEELNTKNRGDINAYLFRAVDKINLLEKMLQIVDHIDETENENSPDTYGKLSEEIKELESIIYRRIPQMKNFMPKEPRRWTPNDLRKKCKVMATSLEQKCLRDEQAFEKNLFKREAAGEDKLKKPLSNIAKKLFPRKAALERKLREKRNAILKTSTFESDLMDPNYIQKKMNDDDISVFKTIVIRDDNSLLDNENDIVKVPEVVLELQTDEPHVELVSQIRDKKEISRVHKAIIHTVTGYVNKVMDAVNKHVSGWWKMFSS